MKLIANKKTLIKLAVSLFIAILISCIHTLFLNWFFIDRISLSPFRYLKAVMSIFPYFYKLSTTAVLLLSFSFLSELFMWYGFYYLNFKDKFSKFFESDNKESLYGNTEWATIKNLRRLGYIFTKGSGLIVGQSGDASFEMKAPNRKEKEQIEAKYLEKMNNPGLTEKEIEELHDEMEEAKGSFAWREIKEGSDLIGTTAFANTIIIGGVGSCKTQGTIIPTLLSWKESVIVNDPKGELFKITAGYRSTFSDVYYLDPTDLTSTFRINVFDFVPHDERGIAAIQGIAEIVIPDNPKASQPYFDRAARNVFVVLALDTIIYGKCKSIGEMLASYKADVSDDISDYFKHIMQKTQDPVNYPVSEEYDELLKELKNNIGALLKEPKETFANITSTITSNLLIFTDRRVISLTNDTTIKKEQFQQTKRPISIYITTPTSEVKRCSVAINLILSQIIATLTSEQLEKDQIKNRVLFVLDEFFQLGKMTRLETAIPIVRSYGIMFMLAIQAISQIQGTYGNDEAKSILENCAIKDIKMVTEPETARWVKEQIGSHSVFRERKTKSKNKGKGGGVSISTTTDEQNRDLITSSEIMGMNYDEQITIIRRGGGSYKGKKIHAFEDSRFKDKMNLPFEMNKEEVPLFEVVKDFTYEAPKKKTAHKKETPQLKKDEQSLFDDIPLVPLKKDSPSLKNDKSNLKGTLSSNKDKEGAKDAS